MKKFITTVFLICFATTVVADQLQIVNPGSEEGAFRQVLSAIGSTVDHDFIQANNPITAYSYFADKNTLTMWSSEWPGDPTFKSPMITEKNLIGLMTYETLMCSRDFDSLESMANKDVKIATWGSKPVQRYLEKLGKEHNINFIVVPYDGSGATVKGYIGSDADTIFTITTKQNAILEDTATKCFAFSENGDLAFRFVDAIVTVNADKKLTEKLRELISMLREKPEWEEKFAGTVTYVGEDYLPMFEEAVANFSK